MLTPYSFERCRQDKNQIRTIDTFSIPPIVAFHSVLEK